MTSEDIKKIVTQLTGVLEGSTSTAFEDKSAKERKVISTFDLAGFPIIGFDYDTWIKEFGLDINDVDILDQLDLDTMQKIMTSHIRINRFVRGHLQHLITTGYMAKFVQSLQRFE